MKKIIQHVISFLLLFIMYNNLYAQNKKGYAELSFLVLDTVQKQFLPLMIYPKFKVWYKKNYGLKLSNLISIVENDSAVTKYEIKVYKYHFIDVKSKIMYEYSTMHRDSLFNKAYVVSDTMPEKAGGYVFWGTLGKDSPFVLKIPIKQLSNISDTIINNIKFKRKQVITHTKTDTTEFNTILRLYFRPDTKGSPLNLAWDYANKFHLPLARFESIVPTPQHTIAYEINYIRFKLTKEEKRIFKAWIRNAKKYKHIVEEKRQITIPENI